MYPMRGYKLFLCCEQLIEERSAGNPHATFCGNRRRATASGDPVTEAAASSDPMFFTTHCFYSVEKLCRYLCLNVNWDC